MKSTNPCLTHVNCGRWVCAPLGTTTIHWDSHHHAIRRKYIPFNYVFCKAECINGFKFAAYALRVWAYMLFGIVLEASVLCGDHSDKIQKGLQAGFELPLLPQYNSAMLHSSSTLPSLEPPEPVEAPTSTPPYITDYAHAYRAITDTYPKRFHNPKCLFQ